MNTQTKNRKTHYTALTAVLATLTGTLLIITALFSQAEATTEPAKLCVVKIVNQQSVHHGTNITIQNKNGDTLAQLIDVESKAGKTSLSSPVTPEHHIIVTPGESGVTSLRPSEVICTPIKKEPATVPSVDDGTPEPAEKMVEAPETTRTPTAPSAIPAEANPKFPG